MHIVSEKYEKIVQAFYITEKIFKYDYNEMYKNIVHGRSLKKSKNVIIDFI